MINLLKSDFYRLFRSKAFYICTLVLVVLTCGSAFLIDWSFRALSASGEAANMPMSSIKDGLSYGLQIFTGGNVPLFISIFIAIFVTGEFTHGTMKNVVSKGFDKISIYLSKVISMIAATYIMIFVTFIFSFFTATIISGKFGTLTASYFGEIIRMVGIELLLFAALASSFVMISMLVRNIGGVIAINIIGILSFLPMIYQLLELLFKNKIHFTYYELQFNMNIYNTNLSPSLEDIIRSIIVGVAYLAVTTLIGVYFFKKSDIK